MTNIYGIMEKKMETKGLVCRYWGYLGIMEKKKIGNCHIVGVILSEAA